MNIYGIFESQLAFRSFVFIAMFVVVSDHYCISLLRFCVSIGLFTKKSKYVYNQIIVLTCFNCVIFQQKHLLIIYTMIYVEYKRKFNKNVSFKKCEIFLLNSMINMIPKATTTKYTLFYKRKIFFCKIETILTLQQL